jgi:hypothetical protein
MCVFCLGVSVRVRVRVRVRVCVCMRRRAGSTISPRYRRDRQPPHTTRTRTHTHSDRDPLSPCWVHDFASTDAHAVIVETPMYISMASLITGAKADHAFMDWRPEQRTRVHVVPLRPDSGPARTFTAPALFSFHTASQNRNVARN